jgi:MinD-like ATPase involved in chromosome partitioning or flagellar assembly
VFVALWSAKGGVGTSVVAAGLALHCARQRPEGTSGEVLIVDAAGDMPTILGLPESPAPGLAGWLEAEAGNQRDDADLPLEGVVEVVATGVSLLPRGIGSLEDGPAAHRLARLLAREARPVIVDCGTAPEGAAAVLARRADLSIGVTRPCYVALRRHVASSLPRPTGAHAVVLVRDPGHALSTAEIEQALRTPVVAEVPDDPAVTRSVDCGLLKTAALPRSLDACFARAQLIPGHGSDGPRRAAAAPDVPPEVSAW